MRECFLSLLKTAALASAPVFQAREQAEYFSFHQSTFLQTFAPLFSIINALSQRNTVMTLFESHLAAGEYGSPLSEQRSGAG